MAWEIRILKGWVMEYRGNVAIVRRKAVLLFLDGLAAIHEVVVPCDAGNHFAPLWPISINLNGRQFKFLRDAHEPQKRPMYKEVTEEEIVDRMEEEFTIEDYKDMANYRNDIIKEMANTILLLKPEFRDEQNVIQIHMQAVENHNNI